MFNHTFHHIYKVLCMVVQLSYRGNIQNIPYLSYIHILWAPYIPQIPLAASSSIARNYFLACLTSIYLDLEGSALVSRIEPKQMLLDTRLWEHVASVKLVLEVSSRVVGCIKQEAVICIYLLHIWLMLHETLKHTNLSMVLISLLLTSAVGLLHSFTKLSVKCG